MRHVENISWTFVLILAAACVVSGSVLAGGGPPPHAGGGSSGGGGGGGSAASGSGSYSILPLDIQIKSRDALGWQGTGVSGSKQPGPDATATQEWTSNRRSPCKFLIKIKNPLDQNPDVPASAYTIYATPRNDKAAIYSFTLGRFAPDGTDITEAIMSESGYGLDRRDAPFRPGESIYITVTVVPVGPANVPRGIRVFWKSPGPSLSGFIPIALPRDRLPDEVTLKEETEETEDQPDYDEDAYPVTIYENPNKGGKKGKNGTSGSSMGLINVGSYSCGTPEVVNAIENGFEGAIVGTDADSVSMPANPGFRKGPVSRALENRAGDIVYVPVHESVSGNGRNASYEVTGVAKCKVDSGTSSSPLQGSVLNYWDDLQSEELPTDSGPTTYDSVDLSVSVSGGSLQMGHWEEVE